MDFSSLSFAGEASWTTALIVTLYFIFIFTVGMRFSRFNSNISDFFYSGRRLSWWLPAISMVATGIGSYSYLKYSEQGLKTGMNSSLAYFNDWLLLPIFLFAWLPILYFNRIQSIPEYFEKRFNRLARYLSVLIILSYLFFYIGFNFFTIGVAFEGIFGIHPAISLPVIVSLLGIYVSFGGQTAVIFTDLFQGCMLYVVGFIVISCGLYALGGVSEFWSYLPQTHRMPMPPLNSDPLFNTSGMLWGDALAGSVAFLYMNQGFIMRFLTIRSVSQIRKATIVNVAITLPTSAAVVGATGWIATSILSKQKAIDGALEGGYELLDIPNSYHTFLLTAYMVVKQNQWIMGFIYATLLAALMSTVDSLITAVSAIGIYDIYKPLIKPKASEKHYLKMARVTAILSTLIGLLLVIWFYKQKGTLMSIHYKGVMLIAPPIVTTVFIGLLWRKFHALSACVAIIVGSIAMIASVIYPEPVYWLRDWLMGSSSNEIIFFRAPFGIAVTALTIYIMQSVFPKGIAITPSIQKIPVLSFILSSLQKDPSKEQSSLTVDTMHQAMVKYKKGEPNLTPSVVVKNKKWSVDSNLQGMEVSLSENICQSLSVNAGDLIYICDQRWFLGGLRSGHFRLKSVLPDTEDQVSLSQEGIHRAYLLKDRKIFLDKTL